MTSKFGHMTLSRQSSGDLSEMTSYYMQGAPPTHSYAPPHHGYHSDSYMSPAMALATPTVPPPQTLGQQSNQVLLQYINATQKLL